MPSVMADIHPIPRAALESPPPPRTGHGDTRGVPSPATGGLSHLDWLEAEAIHVLREVAGQSANPALLFSGGKDSICLLRLAEKAFRPARFPFPLLHIDTGHNYAEVTDFRERRAAELGERLIVRSLEDSIAKGRIVLSRPDEPRNKHQSVTLLEDRKSTRLNSSHQLISYA